MSTIPMHKVAENLKVEFDEEITDEAIYNVYDLCMSGDSKVLVDTDILSILLHHYLMEYTDSSCCTDCNTYFKSSTGELTKHWIENHLYDEE